MRSVGQFLTNNQPASHQPTQSECKAAAAAATTTSEQAWPHLSEDRWVQCVFYSPASSLVVVAAAAAAASGQRSEEVAAMGF